MFLGSLKLNAKHGINTFYMCLITHHIMICKGGEAAGFCNIGVSTAEKAVSSVTIQQRCHLPDSKQSHDQNTCIIQMIHAESVKLASWFGCSRHCIHCTGRHRSWNTSECGGGDRIDYLVPEGK
jgi:hypothetical protein